MRAPCSTSSGTPCTALLSDVTYPLIAAPTSRLISSSCRLSSTSTGCRARNPRRFAVHAHTASQPKALLDRVLAARNFPGFRDRRICRSAMVDMEFHLQASADAVDVRLSKRRPSTDRMPRQIVMRHRTPHFTTSFSATATPPAITAIVVGGPRRGRLQAFEETGRVDAATAGRLRNSIYSAAIDASGGSYHAFRAAPPWSSRCSTSADCAKRRPCSRAARRLLVRQSRNASLLNCHSGRAGGANPEPPRKHHVCHPVVGSGRRFAAPGMTAGSKLFARSPAADGVERVVAQMNRRLRLGRRRRPVRRSRARAPCRSACRPACSNERRRRRCPEPPASSKRKPSNCRPCRSRTPRRRTSGRPRRCRRRGYGAAARHVAGAGSET